jgi:DNA-binding transcriptional LysR family regulator
VSQALDLVSLRLFVAVCEHGSLARAAEKEALVASALSKRIAALEADLGSTLLLRRRRGVQPTPAGEALLRHAREVLSATQRLRAELGGFAHGVQGSVRVLASASVLAGRLPDDLAAFLSTHAALRVSLEERSSGDILRSLHSGGADVGVLWDAPDLSGLQVWPYRSDRLCVAMSPAHPLARRPGLRFDDILEQDTIGVVPGGLMDAMLRRQAALRGHVLAPRIQVSSIDAACRIVAAGLGLAVLPRELVAAQATSGRLSLVPLDEPWARRQFVVCTRMPPLQSASTQRLVEHLRSCGD